MTTPLSKMVDPDEIDQGPKGQSTGYTIVGTQPNGYPMMEMSIGSPGQNPADFSGMVDPDEMDTSTQEVDTYLNPYDDQGNAWDYMKFKTKKEFAETGGGLLNMFSGPGDAIQATQGIPPFNHVANLKESLGVTQDMKPPSEEAAVAGDITGEIGSAAATLPLAFIGQGSAAARLGRYGMDSVRAGIGRSIGEAESGTDLGGDVGAIIGGVVNPSLLNKPVAAAAKYGKKLYQGVKNRKNLEEIGVSTAKAADDLSTQFAESKASQDLARYIHDYPGSLSNMDEAARIEGRVRDLGGTDLSLTLAERTRNPAVSSQYEALARDNPSNLAKAITATEKNQAAVNTAKEAVTGGSSSLKPALRDLKMRVQVQRGVNQMELAHARRSYAEALTGVESNNPLVVGQSLKALRIHEKTLAAEEFTKRIDALTARMNEAGDVVDPQPLTDLVDSVRANPNMQWDEKNIPTIFNRVSQELKPHAGSPAPMGKAMDWGTVDANGPPGSVRTDMSVLKSLREEVGADIRALELSHSQNARHQLRALSGIKTEIDNVMDAAAKASNDPVIFDDYAKWRTDYREDFIQRFRTGVGAEMDFTKINGENFILDENVTEKFLKSQASMNRFMRMFAKNDDALNALQDGILDLYRRKTVLNGVFSEPAHHRFLKQYDLQLDNLPELKKQLMDTGSNINVINARVDLLEKNAQKIDRSLIAKAVDFSNVKDVDDLVTKAVSNPRLMVELLRDMAPTARGAVLRNVTKRIVDQDPGAAFKYIQDNEVSLKIVFRHALGAKKSLEHMDNIKSIVAVEELVQQYGAKNWALGAEKTINTWAQEWLKKRGLSAAQIFAAGRAIMRSHAYGSAPYFGGIFFGQAVNANALEKMKGLIHQAMYDPELAKELAAQAKTLNLDVMGNLEKAQRLAGKVLPHVKGEGIRRRAVQVGPRTYLNENEQDPNENEAP